MDPQKKSEPFMSNGSTIRLLVDAHVFDQEFQGSRTFVRELYRSMIGRSGLDIYFAAYDIESLRREFPGVAADRFVRFSSRSSLYRLLIDIPRIVKRYRIDYAHFQYIVPVWKNCRFIVTTHDVIFREQPGDFSFFYRFFKTILYRFGAARADILTTVSDHSRGSIRKYLGVKHGEIVLTPLAVEPAFFAPHDKVSIRKTFASKYGFDKFLLCVSRFETRKNHALLLRTYLKLGLHRYGYHLVMLGHRSLPVPELDALLDGLNEELRPFVIVRSDVADDELLFFYQAASLFVYPSRAEGFGLPPLEAAAVQTPVVCSNTTAMASFDLFGQGHIDPNDEAGFVQTVSTMLQDPPSPEKLGQIAETVRQRYSWELGADNLYTALLSDATQATPVFVSS